MSICAILRCACIPSRHLVWHVIERGGVKNTGGLDLHHEKSFVDGRRVHILVCPLLLSSDLDLAMCMILCTYRVRTGFGDSELAAPERARGSIPPHSHNGTSYYSPVITNPGPVVNDVRGSSG